MTAAGRLGFWGLWPTRSIGTFWPARLSRRRSRRSATRSGDRPLFSPEPVCSQASTWKEGVARGFAAGRDAPLCVGRHRGELVWVKRLSAFADGQGHRLLELAFGWLLKKGWLLSSPERPLRSRYRSTCRRGRHGVFSPEEMAAVPAA